MLKPSQKKSASHKKTAPKKPSSRAPKSFLHKMLTAEGWKRLMMGKSRKS